MFKVLKKSKKSCARRGVLKTKSGEIQTPFFMPIATRGVIKSLSFSDIEKLNPEIILANTYHLYLKPGLDVIKKFKSLRAFMNCKYPILTDSGGFQVFSLSKIRKINKTGVEFQSTYDGSYHFFTPEKVMKIQSVLDSDIQMVLDICLDSKSDYKKVKESLDVTTLWAKKCKDAKKKFDPKHKNLLFGIVQGALDKELRQESLNDLVKIGFDGYAIGGLAVGETNQEMYKILEFLSDKLPEKNPRYLMGVGYPENILTAVKNGVDMFDCVIPTREARHGRLYFFENKNLKGNFYKTINITNSKFVNDKSVINKDSKTEELKIYSKAYLNHLFKVGDILAMRLATLNNIEFYLDLMKIIRKNIEKGLI
ncbi:MAG TPA: tRNA guanosine(34) transglycosylase Tgt [bacterium]|nr:tRNA guanosine(34) transglycosylase Tgt [bacterium]